MSGCEIDKPYRISIKSVSVREYIELDIQNTKPPRTNGHIICYV